MQRKSRCVRYKHYHKNTSEIEEESPLFLMLLLSQNGEKSHRFDVCAASACVCVFGKTIKQIEFYGQLVLVRKKEAFYILP